MGTPAPSMRDDDRTWLRGDVVAGITVAAYAVPQVMAYAELAGLPVASGLYALLVPLAIYAVLGSSRQLSVGPESTTALMTAVAIGPLARGDPTRAVALAALLAGLMGLWCLVAWVMRFGVIADLLSHPVLVGYMSGVAITMIVSQLGTLTGADVTGGSVLDRLVSFVGAMDTIDPVTTGLSLAVLALLAGISRWWPRAPGSLLVVLGASALVAAAGWADRLDVVGQIPSGLPLPRVPDVSTTDVGMLVWPALGLMMVGYTDNVLTARSFAVRRREEVDANRELAALGVSNLGVALTQGMPISSSGSRTALGDDAGSRTQLYSVVALAAVVATLFLFRPVLATFPLAALGALVVHAAWRLIDRQAFVRLARFRRAEVLLALATTVSVLVLDILVGVVVAVVLSVAELLVRVARPHDAIQGLVPGLAGMHDVDDYPEAETLPGLVVYRYDSPLFFANAADFRRRAIAAIDQVEAVDGPVRWLVLNVEANVEVDSTAVDGLKALRLQLVDRGIVLALARVKQDLAVQLDRAGFLAELGRDRVFPTLPTALDGYRTWLAEQVDDTPRHEGRDGAT
ncbi:SulP family inorganic anion transporter [Salsipaludibacter albus]|uniref:SulP family inorganic anion transporter n=1 Tax=Salsipaludibacter albus TaxID=2849650 RepID=UPI001EE3BB87|nr:SulP family inorganic anion transporter [Salsipaludibacter albus]MBY5162029.1 SulP family inorganic anion transporter [Salsipaludibacter albus]